MICHGSFLLVFIAASFAMLCPLHLPSEVNQPCVRTSPPFGLPPHSGPRSKLSRVLCAVQMFSSTVCFIHAINSVWASQVVLVVKSQCRRCKRHWFNPCRDTGLIPGSGRSPEGGNGNPLQYSCPENPMKPSGLWSIGLQRVETRLK